MSYSINFSFNSNLFKKNFITIIKFWLLSFVLFVFTYSKQLETNPLEKITTDKKAKIYTTAQDSAYRISLTNFKKFEWSKQPLESEISIIVNPKHTFQTHLGIGGAITDASAEVFAKLSKQQQEEFLKSYYSDSNGIGLTLARTNIHSCDFSSSSYVYVSDSSKDLRTFTIKVDKNYKIPLIKEVIKTTNGQLKLFASPWSPPAFMKDNKHMLKGGKLLKNYYDSWALYFSKFIKSYEAERIPIWGISVQNEPLAIQPWESCIFTSEEERDFIKSHLGPRLAKDGLDKVKLIVWDHNRDLIGERANTILDDPEAAKYVWGIGYHWYETWSGGTPKYENVKSVKESYPNKNLLLTEACIDKFDTSGYTSWSNAEQFGNSIINDFNNGTVGWTFWNVLLDEKGGPNHVGNYCFAPIHANTRTGKMIYTPTFYYIGHFSKFIRPNALRIGTTTSKSDLMATSFRNENGSMVTVVMNQTGKSIDYKLHIEKNSISTTIAPHSIQTIVY